MGFRQQVKVDEAFVRRGKEKYDIHCAICHGANGEGKGVTSDFGVANIANFNLPQFAEPSNGQYRTNGSMFNTITNGQGLMGAYGANIAIKDRWAIVAYVRAMQKTPQTPRLRATDTCSIETFRNRIRMSHHHISVRDLPVGGEKLETHGCRLL